jgi:lysophospholipase L1-like esterase
LLVLGDSMTFGYGVRDDETYPAVLQALLNEGKAPGTFEVINVSRAGVGPWEYLLYLETFGRWYRPDVVLIGLYLGNDLIEVVDPYEAAGGLWRVLRSRLRKTFPHTYALLAHINSRRRARGEFLESGQLTAAEFTAYLDAAAGREGVPQEAVHSRLRQVDPETYRLVLRGEVNPSLLMKALLHVTLMRDVMLLETPEMARAWMAARGALRQMFQESRRLGARPVVVLIPDGMQVSGAVADLYRRLGFLVDPAAVESRRPQALVTDFARANGVPVVDLTNAFLRPAAQAAYLPLDTHWNPLGHRIAAQAIREALVRHGVIGAGRATP